jgi:uncharacterized repeat protein (TIGR03943 family)
MTRLYTRWLPCATLLAWSGMLLYFYTSGRIVNALHPMFRPGVALAGVVMFVLALIFLFFPASAEGCMESCSQPLARGRIGKLLTFVVLILPIAAATVASPDGFSVNTVKNRGIALDLTGFGRPDAKSRAVPSVDPFEPPLPTKDGAPAPAPKDTQAESIDQFVPKTPEGHLALQVVDLLYAAEDPSLRQDIESKTVQLVGQIMPDTVSNSTGRRFKLVRMFMTCCAADARPIAALVEGQTAPQFPDMAWVKVVGKATFPIEGGRTLAVIQADSVTPTEPPEESMLY